MCDLLAKLGKDSRGKIRCVAAARVLLLTPVLFLIVHRLTDINRWVSVLKRNTLPEFVQLCDKSLSKLTCKASSELSTLE